MTNPFSTQNMNPADQLFFGDRPITGGGAGHDPNAVVFDAVSKSVNPAGAALVQELSATITQQVMSQVKARDQNGYWP